MNSPVQSQSFHFRIACIRRWGYRHVALYYTVPLVIWTIIVMFGSLAPPSKLPRLEFDLADKLEHAASYAILAILLIRAWNRGGRSKWSSYGWVLAIAASWGFYLEILQELTPYRTFDWWDFIANGLGGFAGLIAWILLIFFYLRCRPVENPQNSAFSPTVILDKGIDDHA